MKKRYTGIMAILALAICLCGCGESIPPDKTILVFSHGILTPEVRDAMGKLIDEFESKNPKVKVVRHELAPTTDLQRSFYLLTFAAKSEYIDVFELDIIWTAELAAGKMLLPLEKELGSEWKGKYLGSSLRTAMYNDKLYALPFFSTGGALFYRKDLLKKHGMKAPRSWEEVKTQAKKIGEAEGIDGFLFQGKHYEGLVCHFLEIYRSLGGQITSREQGISMEAEIVAKAMEHLKGLIKDKIAPPSVLEMTEQESLARFTDGKAVFLRCWNDLERQILKSSLSEEQVGMAFLPQFGENKSVPTIGGWLLGINARTNHKPEAVTFIKFMTSEKSQKMLAKTLGRLPTLSGLYDEKKELALRDVKRHQQILRSAEQRPVSPYYHEFSKIIQDEVYAALVGELKIEEAVKILGKRLSKVELPSKARPEFPKQLLIPSTIY